MTTLPLIAPAGDGGERQGESLHLRVYRDLRDGLMAGLYAPGQPLSLRRIAAAAGTSPMPVRQAVNRLIAERALVLLPNRTVVVPHLARTSFMELTAVRRSLEGMAAELAAERGGEGVVAELLGINASLRRAIEAGDSTAALRTNQRFHFCLYRASASEVILPLIEALWLQVGPLIHLSRLRLYTNWDARLHEAAIAALAANDPAGVRSAIQADIQDAADNLLRAEVFTS